MVDTVDSGMRVWAPATLVRKNNEEDQGVSDDAFNLPPIEAEYEAQRSSKITALFSHPSLPIVFAGKQDGQVLAFSTRTGRQVALLYTHDHAASVTQMAIGDNYLLASSHINGHLQVWKLGTSGQLSTFENRSLAFQMKMPVQAFQLCFSRSGDHLLVSTEIYDTVYSTEDGSCVGTLSFTAQQMKIWPWLVTPGQRDQFYLVLDHVMVKYSAKGFPSSIPDHEVQLQYEVGDGTEEVGIELATINLSTQTLAFEIRHTSGFISSTILFLFDLSKVASWTSSGEKPILAPICNLLSRHCKQFVVA